MGTFRLDAPRGFQLQTGEGVLIRDLLPSDAALYPPFHAKVTAEDRRTRFFSASPLSEAQIARLTRSDAAHSVVRAALNMAGNELLGVARLHRVEKATGEFAVMVRSDLKGQGLGRRLLQDVIDRAPTIGIDVIEGLVLPENSCMRGLVRSMGFHVTWDAKEPGLLRARLSLPRSMPAAA